MSNNTNLAEANKVKNDEFYTKLTDVEKELMHYKDMFVGKTIYCNCDDPVIKKYYYRFGEPCKKQQGVNVPIVV